MAEKIENLKKPKEKTSKKWYEPKSVSEEYELMKCLKRKPMVRLLKDIKTPKKGIELHRLSCKTGD
jgi:hypothetical protein